MGYWGGEGCELDNVGQLGGGGCLEGDGVG